MRIKTLGRISGALTSSIGMLGYNWCDNLLNKIDYDRLQDFFLNDNPLETKVAFGSYLVLVNLLAPAMSLITVDGLTDVFSGTHHYFSLSLASILSKNRKMKREINLELEEQLSILDHHLS